VIAKRIETAHGTVLVLPVGEDEHALHPEEIALAAPFAPRRRRVFAAGREAMRRALSALGHAREDLSILSNARGAPILPEGFRGSISHKETIAVALARRSGDRGDPHLGIDVEIDRERTIDVSRRVLTDEELSEAGALDPTAFQAFVLRRFSMKEAIYKAIDPFLRRYVGFREVTIRGAGSQLGAVGQFREDEPTLAIDVAYTELSIEGARIIVSTASARREWGAG
jgi:4'-phosphopantetheinyl transferase EntD